MWRMSHGRWWEPAGRSHQEPLTPEQKRDQDCYLVSYSNTENPIPVIALQMQVTWNRPSLYPPAAGAAAGSSSKENEPVREL